MKITVLAKRLFIFAVAVVVVSGALLVFKSSNKAQAASASTNVIQGHVFLGTKPDQIYSAGDTGLAGVVIKKWGDKYEQITTTSTGYYKFFNLPARGDYKITYTPPPGYIILSQSSFDNLSLPPNRTFNPVFRRNRYEIKGHLYQDTDGVPGFSAGDKIFPNMLVTKTGDRTESMRTTSTGYYRFFNLPPRSDYFVFVERPQGYEYDSEHPVANIDLGPNDRIIQFKFRPSN